MDQIEQQIIFRSVSDLVLLKSNPRKITKADFERLCDSMRINGFWTHRPIALSDRTGELVILAGNQRLKAAKKLKLDKVPTVLYHTPTTDQEVEIIFRDNVNNGEWDNNKMNDPLFESVDFDFMGISLDDPEDKPKKKKGTKLAPEDEDNDDFYRSMWEDVLYYSDNKFDIPNLLLDHQAEHLELPLSTWGRRLAKNVATYHFYDCKFEDLFRDPIKLVTSGCKAIVETNCLLNDQTPVAWGLQLLYKKRFLSRYLQECGINVYIDLNVSPKFTEYNKIGIPKGYNAFFTRVVDGDTESLNSNLKVAQEISCLESPNLCVYGGGEEIQEFCKQHDLLYVTDPVKAKKK